MTMDSQISYFLPVPGFINACQRTVYGRTGRTGIGDNSVVVTGPAVGGNLDRDRG